MKLPGRACLEFEVEVAGQNAARLRQTAIFDPMGLAGLVYWYALYPVHSVMLRGMLGGIAQAAEQHRAGDADSPPVADNG